jgi:hypothetical protein
MSSNKRRKIDFTNDYYQSALYYNIKALETLVQDYINHLNQLQNFYNSVYAGQIEDNTESILEEIKLLDRCLEIRREIGYQLFSIKQKLSYIYVPEIRFDLDTKLNSIYNLVVNEDSRLSHFHYVISPFGDLLTHKEHMELNDNPYLFYYSPPPPPPNTNQNNTNRNIGSGIRRNRRSLRGGSLVSTLFPSFLFALALL